MNKIIITNKPDWDKNFNRVAIRKFQDPPTFSIVDYPVYGIPMESDNKSQNKKIWLGLVLAGVAAAGAVIHKLNKKDKNNEK